MHEGKHPCAYDETGDEVVKDSSKKAGNVGLVPQHYGEEMGQVVSW